MTDLVYSTSKLGYELKAETARKPSDLVPIYLNYIKRPFFGAGNNRKIIILFNIHV